MTSRQMIEQIDTQYPPVTDAMLQEIVLRIRRVGSPLKILMFGSRARGTAKPDSDIDVMIIEDVGCNTQELQANYREALRDLFPEWTVLVYPMNEVVAWQRVPNHLITETLRIGNLLFEDEVRLHRYHAYPQSGGEDSAELFVCEDVESKTPADLAKEWFQQAEDDLRVVRLVLEDGPPYNLACYHLQQALEKYFKGFLQFHGQPTFKSHDLDSLRWHCKQILDLPELPTLSLKEMSEFVELRYKVGITASLENAEVALATVEEIRRIMLEAVPPEARP